MPEFYVFRMSTCLKSAERQEQGSTGTWGSTFRHYLTRPHAQETEKTPTERLALPITGNMEYGFFTQPLNPANPMFDYKTRTCDVTKYANSFVNNTGSR